MKGRRSQPNINLSNYDSSTYGCEAGCLFALITSRRSVSRRNRASWFLRQLNKPAKCEPIELVDSHIEQSQSADESKENKPIDHSNENDIHLVSLTIRPDCSPTNNDSQSEHNNKDGTTENIPILDEDCSNRFIVTTNTRAVYLSKSIASSIVLDLSPSIVSVNPQNNCVFLDSIFDALKRVLHLLVKEQELPSQIQPSPRFAPQIFVTVIAYTPFIVAKNNQVLIQNRRISSLNIDQVLVEIWICLNRLTHELHDLVSSSCDINLEYESTKASGTTFVFPQSANGGIIRHPGSVLEDIYELGLFYASLMPRLSRLSNVVISDGLFASTNNLNIFRLKSIAVSFVSLCAEEISPDSCFGYTSYSDLMRFVAKSTQGVYITHQDLIRASQNLSGSKRISFVRNPLFKLFCWTLHSDINSLKSFNIDSPTCDSEPDNCNNNCPTSEPFMTPNSKSFDDVQSALQQPFDAMNQMKPEQIAKFFCIDQSIDSFSLGPSILSPIHHDWRAYKQLERELDADFEQVLSCLLREGYLVKSIHIKHRETSRIVARLVLHWKHNLDLEQELSAPYWKNNSDPFDLNDGNDLILRPFNGPLYGDTLCEIFVHGSYSFLHNLYCDKKVKRRSEYRDIAYKQFRMLIDGILQTHERLQYLSRFYRDASISKIPPFLLHGNSLLYEQPHTHKLTSTIENVVDDNKTSEFQEYWQKISCLDTKSWKNLMHVHTLRLVLEHDQPKHKNILCQNASGRYTHIQCRRAMGAISNFIKNYASFALLEDSTYIKFIYNKENDLRQIETSATKGFIVIRINKLLPIVVIYLMFTSGILDSSRVKIVSYLEDQLVNCKVRNVRISTTTQNENILRSKTIHSSSESCILIRSPLERMLKVYSRNFVGESLAQNPTLGLPGSCPYNVQPAPATVVNRKTGQPVSQQKSSTSSFKDSYFDGHSAANSSINRYNLVFGKYLYGVRVIHTIAYLPHDLIQSLATNVLAKISAILVNVRIKQGFHIAFNNSGILNLVVELMMQDCSHVSASSPPDSAHISTCLCQYIVFPPTITSCAPRPSLIQNKSPDSMQQQNQREETNEGRLSKPASLSGSCANSDNSFHMRSSNLTDENITSSSIVADIVRQNGEVKVIREYWTEQQYGISTDQCSDYHSSLSNMRYSELVDHLYLTDTKLFDCLLTYEILQMLCDKLSPFHELDLVLHEADRLFEEQSQQAGPSNGASTHPLSPTNSSSSTSTNLFSDAESPSAIHPSSNLPSVLIEGNNRDGNSRIPLIELTYKFSIVNFLDFCQEAVLNVLFFKDTSDYYKSPFNPYNQSSSANLFARPNEFNSKLNKPETEIQNQSRLPHQQNTTRPTMRKMSIDVNMFDHDGRSSDNHREHRSSYDSSNYSTTPINNSQSAAAIHGAMHQQQHQYASYAISSICSSSLNHLFLETLHKRLRQMHDKELRLTSGDRRMLSQYLKRRKLLTENGDSSDIVDNQANESEASMLDFSTSDETTDHTLISNELVDEDGEDDAHMNWRCFMRKRNQENMMIVFVPSSLRDIAKWRVLQATDLTMCPIVVFRCSSTMLNQRVLSFLHNDQSEGLVGAKEKTERLDRDIALHFGQPCKYLGDLFASNDELDNEIGPLNKLNSESRSDEETIEIVHFRAFLRKIKNTVLKSRFSSLNDAYLSELFIHKDDLLYYIKNVDIDTQKKYHVSAQLKNVTDFIKVYEDYVSKLPREQSRPYNRLLNSILLQKCGLFANQPIARFDESDPLMKQLQDRKLLHLMRCNYKIQLPILEESLAHSKMLKVYLDPSTAANSHSHHHHTASSSRHKIHRNSQSFLSPNNSSPPTSVPVGSLPTATATSSAASSLNNQTSHDSKSGAKLMEARYGSSIGAGGNSGPMLTNSFSASSGAHLFNSRVGVHTTPRLSASSCNSAQLHSTPSGTVLSNSANDSFILEAFKNASCSIGEISEELTESITNLSQTLGPEEVLNLRHEAHMAEVLRRKYQRRESHQYRRVLKSKTNYSQSYSAIDQALKRVDSLGRLEHFCLTPLLFSPAWRSKLAPVRDHTLNSYQSDHTSASADVDADTKQVDPFSQSTASNIDQKLTDERWHQLVCNNYIKEYEQYIQTLGFNSVQIRYPAGVALSGTNFQPSTIRSSNSSRKGSSRFSSNDFHSHQNQQVQSVSNQSPQSNSQQKNRRDSLVNICQTPPQQLQQLPNQNSATPNVSNSSYNTGYLIKFLNSGCLVFKVGFCRPYVYSILYSIEGERFNNADSTGGSKSARPDTSSSAMNKISNMIAFLDELDSIKVTMHLHSFTYDYHLRSMYSYISGRQMTFSHGYHLISFVDDFRKYYQKAPNYARNHLLSGEVCVKNLLVNGQELYNYIVTHNTTYGLDVLEMTAAVGLIKSTTFMSSSFKLKSTSGTPSDCDFSDFTNRDHANDYVLIELKREKVRYKNGKDPDVLDCALLITHSNISPSSSRRDSSINSSNSGDSFLKLKYFLLLTNQRDLYPKLVHSPENNLISSGCHRPIRLGATSGLASTSIQSSSATVPVVTVEQTASNCTVIESRSIETSAGGRLQPNFLPPPLSSSVATTATTDGATNPHSDLDETRSSNDILLSSSEFSGPPSILSATTSVHSAATSAGLQFATTTTNSDNDTGGSMCSVDSQVRQSAQNSLVTRESVAQIFSNTELSESQMGTMSDDDDQAAPAEEAADALAMVAASMPVVLDSSNSHQIARSSSFRLNSSKASTDHSNDRNLSAPPESAQNKSRKHDSNESSGAATLALDHSDGTHLSRDQSRQTGLTEGSASSKQGDESKQQRNRTSSLMSANSTNIPHSVMKNKSSAICDEEITYLGYFSSDEMDMLRFLQEKTTNLRLHIEKIVRAAEVHYRRDYLWQKLMQRHPQQIFPSMQHQILGGALPNATPLSADSIQPSATSMASSADALTTTSASGSKTATSSPISIDQFQTPLTVEELIQLLQIIKAVDLSKLDPQLVNFTSMNLNWYLKLLKAFQDLKQSPMNAHRIYQVKASKTLLLFIDPRYVEAFILLSLDEDRGLAEINLMLKDNQESPLKATSRPSSSTDLAKCASDQQSASMRSKIELDMDCQQLINDFVNFCAAFMWSTFLTG